MCIIMVSVPGVLVSATFLPVRSILITGTYLHRYRTLLPVGRTGTVRSSTVPLRTVHTGTLRATDRKMTANTLNANPTVYEAALDGPQRSAEDLAAESDLKKRDPIDNFEVFDLIRAIKDPEHPHTLEQLRVAQSNLISVDDARSRVHVNFTPTIPHCSMATLIGLCIRVKLLRTLPSRFKIDVNVTPGTHASEAAVNKQLNDKERVAAALENENLLSVVNKCLAGVDGDDDT